MRAEAPVRVFKSDKTTEDLLRDYESTFETIFTRSYLDRRHEDEVKQTYIDTSLVLETDRKKGKEMEAIRVGISTFKPPVVEKLAENKDGVVGIVPRKVGITEVLFDVYRRFAGGDMGEDVVIINGCSGQEAKSTLVVPRARAGEVSCTSHGNRWARTPAVAGAV